VRGANPIFIRVPHANHRVSVDNFAR
jgi:hypothetical protein